MAAKIGRTPFTAILVSLLVIVLWALSARGVEAAKPGPVTSCEFTDHVICTVSLDTRGRTPDWVGLTVFDCVTNGSLDYLATESPSKGDVIHFDSHALTRAYLTVWVRAGSHNTAIWYGEDHSLCDDTP